MTENKRIPFMIGFSLSADEIVARHIQNGSFDSAMAAARSLEVDMTSIFGNLTAQCMRLARLGEEMYVINRRSRSPPDTYALC